jgi:D-aminoacyl-tRNA deacylase
MRIVLQRVTEARVDVEQVTIGAIGPGALLLVGVGPDDTEQTVAAMADKVAHLRIFDDEVGKLNFSLLDCGGAALVVSQFTLLANTSRGRRPSFIGAAAPAIAEPLVNMFANTLRGMGVSVAQGKFGAHMRVGLVNDGPVTIILESA